MMKKLILILFFISTNICSDEIEDKDFYESDKNIEDEWEIRKICPTVCKKKNKNLNYQNEYKHKNNKLYCKCK